MINFFIRSTKYVNEIQCRLELILIGLTDGLQLRVGIAHPTAMFREYILIEQYNFYVEQWAKS